MRRRRRSRQRPEASSAGASRMDRWLGSERRRGLAAAGTALLLHAGVLALLGRQAQEAEEAGRTDSAVVQADIVGEPMLHPLLPPRGGQVIESPGASLDEVPTAETRRIAERNANTERESRRRASASESGQRAREPRVARAVDPPRAPTAQSADPGGVLVPVPDAGAVAASTDAGSSAALAASDPGGAAAGISLDLADHADDDLTDVPLGDQTRLRAHASSYAGFLNLVRDRVRKLWRVREVYQSSDPDRRFRGGALVTELAVRVAPDGTVTRTTVEKGSGLEAVDAEAGAAMRRAGPFPPPAGIADADGSFSFTFTFTFDLSPLRFLTAVRQTLLERWRPSRAFRQVGDHQRITAVRVLIRRDGEVVQINPVASAGIDFLDAGALQAVKIGDRLPALPDSFPRLPGGVLALWVEFQHRVGSPSDIRVSRRYRLPGQK
jgi:TonB family protein